MDVDNIQFSWNCSHCGNRNSDMIDLDWFNEFERYGAQCEDCGKFSRVTPVLNVTAQTEPMHLDHRT